MFIEIEDLQPEPLEVRHTFPAKEIGFRHDDAIIVGPVTVEFTLEHKEKDLYVAGNLNTTVHYTCSRCNREFDRELSARFGLSYLPQPEQLEEGAEIELKYEDMEVAFYDGIALDVNLMLVEQIELAIPMKIVCGEECKGLCQKCGADLNEGKCSCGGEEGDPRLAALMDFKRKMKN